MRRRRLFRYAAHTSQEFDQGVRYGLEMARRRMVGHGFPGVVAIAARGKNSFALDYEASSTARSVTAPRGGPGSGFAAGFAAGMRAAAIAGGQNPTHDGYQYSDIENARRMGFDEGRLAATNSSVIGSESVRKKAIDDILESCRVIAESNPNMTSGAFLKAVQHRSKKIY